MWWIALVVALGTIVQDENSLLACAEGTDEGHDQADPVDKVRPVSYTHLTLPTIYSV